MGGNCPDFQSLSKIFKKNLKNTEKRLTNLQNVEQKYLASEVTCTEKAKYYFSCECGEKGSDTFEYGEAKGHTYSEEWSYSETEHWHAATCGHTLVKDRAEHTFDENKKCTVCEYVSTKSNGVELKSSDFEIDLAEKTAYLEVPYRNDYCYLGEMFTVADGATFEIYTDEQCSNIVMWGVADLDVGDNVFYILVTNGSETERYTITLYRRRGYAVSFDTNGGSYVETQYVEEGGFATEPTTEKRGYKFIKWDYDFSLPILKNETITAEFSVEEEMQNYIFTSTEDICTITGVIDKTITKAVVPDYVTGIENGAFRDCTSLADITLPFIGASKTANNGFDQVFGYIFGYITTNDPEKAFAAGMTPQWVEENSMLFYCYYIPSSLKNITLSESVTSISNMAFAYCTGLENITIPNSVTSIGYGAFV